MRLSFLLVAAFSLFAAVILNFGARITINATSGLRDIRHAALFATADSMAVSATVAMSLERSVVQGALAYAEPIPWQFRDLLTQQRVFAEIASAKNETTESLTETLSGVSHAARDVEVAT